MHGRGGNEERPVEALAVERLRALGERARRLATEVLAAVEQLEALALELAAARYELPAPERPGAERAAPERPRKDEPAPVPPRKNQSPSEQVMERLQRLTGQQRALIAEAVERRQQLEAAGLLAEGERRTFRVVPPSDDNIVVQVRAPGERNGMTTYVMRPEELQQLLPPEDDAAREGEQPPPTERQPRDDNH